MELSEQEIGRRNSLNELIKIRVQKHQHGRPPDE
jgi:hypothetical protein